MNGLNFVPIHLTDVSVQVNLEKVAMKEISLDAMKPKAVKYKMMQAINKAF